MRWDRIRKAGASAGTCAMRCISPAKTGAIGCSLRPIDQMSFAECGTSRAPSITRSP